MEEVKYIIQFEALGFDRFELVKTNEDELYDILEMAMTTHFITISHELQIYQISYKIDTRTEFQHIIMRSASQQESDPVFKEKVIKLVDGKPSGFTMQEAYDVITNHLIARWEKVYD